MAVFQIVWHKDILGRFNTVNINILLKEGWTLNETGRELFKYMAAPNRSDPINALNRKYQSTIFRLRTQHIALNKHLHRIGANTTPACPLCNHPEESVDHHLYLCTPLNDLRTCLSSPLYKQRKPPIWKHIRQKGKKTSSNCYCLAKKKKKKYPSENVVLTLSSPSSSLSSLTSPWAASLSSFFSVPASWASSPSWPFCSSLASADSFLWISALGLSSFWGFKYESYHSFF